jgi:methionyl-tRNA formyltransferase
LAFDHFILATSKPWHKPQAATSLPDEAGFLWAHNPEQLNDLTASERGIRYIFFLHWNWLVPEHLWQNYECVCFHMTDVPYGRGGSPLQNLIVRGHKDTKLTALRMVNEMDAGPVYSKRELSLEGTAAEIYQRAGQQSFDIIRWMIDSQPEPLDQQGEPVVFKRRKPEQSALPVSGDLPMLYDHIRMLDAPTYPLAFIEHGEFIIEFSDARVQGDELNASVRIRKKPNERKL